eukprot:CAMPEP_0119354118 /NCGR_PEP_ID=MMETSP1334-20130426/3174_1 /TAXON_ID=127549 /ORGANISM="Calcidiscus leptoporus, Strain RCC1130" /LENGTH=438 /DNA_ID=CAMNT_0007367587 /DNA_START=64 /DNA_END=1380 /DNA_ORIENTATION=-
MILRIRTKDGTERLTVEDSASLGKVRMQIESSFGVPLQQQQLSRSEPAGINVRKGAAFTQADDSTPITVLGMSSGYIVFLDYEMNRENQATSQAYAKDPFVSLVKDGELRRQGTNQWTLTNFLDYRSTKEFQLGKPPEPHCHYVQVDPAASQAFINFMIVCGFGSKRLGVLYGKWTEDDEGKAGVQVHAVYEPKQESTSDDIVLLDNEAADHKVAALATMLGLHCVGVIIAHPARQYAFSVNEIKLAARYHSQALEADADKGKLFVTMKARPVLEDEKDIEGIATMEAYQLTDQAVELCSRDAFYESKTDPRVAKTAADCCFIIDKKEQRKATMEPFVARVFDIARPFASFLGSGFAIENRPTEPQSSQSLTNYVRQRRDRREPFLKTVSDLHLLLFLSNLLDMQADMPVLCSKVVEGTPADELDGFQMMINCYAGLQ